MLLSVFITAAVLPLATTTAFWNGVDKVVPDYGNGKSGCGCMAGMDL